MAATIPALIPPRAYELIRSRIVQILGDEIYSQVLLTYDEEDQEKIDASVWEERVIPFDPTEYPVVNVMLARGGFQNKSSVLQKTGEYSFYIDVHVRAKTTNDESGDTTAAIDLQRLLGLCDAILSDQAYIRLGFGTTPPFISHVSSEGFVIADPQRSNDANHSMMGRLTFNVRCIENTATIEGVLAGLPDTQVRIGLTEKGYVFGGEPAIVPSPLYPPGSVYNSLGELLGEAPSGEGFTVDDSDIAINGDPFTSLPATNNLDISLIDQDGYDITPDNIYGDEVTVDMDRWRRHPGWLPMPEVNAGDNVFYGLYAVYEDTQVFSDELSLYFNDFSTASINWGDGNSESPTANKVTHIYNYSAITSIILQDAEGYNYKQVIVQVDFGASPAVDFRIERLTDYSVSDYRSVNWLDIVIDNSAMTTLALSYNDRNSIYLERIKILNNSITNTGTLFYELTNLRILDWDYSGVTSQLLFFGMGNVRKPNNDPLDVIVLNCTLFTMRSSGVTKLGELNVPNSVFNSGALPFYLNRNLQEVGDCNFSSAENLRFAFQQCRNLREIGTITTSSALTSLEHIFDQCISLKSINITDCSNVINTNLAFNICRNLNSIILTGITVGFNISFSSLDATAINALFTSLGTASGSQTVNVSNNPGSSTCDTSIATAKGWTVVT